MIEYMLPRRYIGFHGRPVERTPELFPYSYDAFYEWMADDANDSDHFVYDDRMRQWSWDGFHDAVKQVWGERHGQMFYGDKPKDIERFLALYWKKNIRLTGVMRGANCSSGYPYWVFQYREEPPRWAENAYVSE